MFNIKPHTALFSAAIKRVGLDFYFVGNYTFRAGDVMLSMWHTVDSGGISMWISYTNHPSSVIEFAMRRSPAQPGMFARPHAEIRRSTLQNETTLADCTSVEHTAVMIGGYYGEMKDAITRA